MSAKGKKPTNNLFAQSYFGTSTVSRTMTMLASTAIKLWPSVIDTIRSIMNSEHQNLCVRQTCVGNCGATTSKEALHFVDCRVFKGFIRLQSFYGSTSFISPNIEIDYDRQVNCFYRVKNLCKLNKFRTVQH